MSENLRAECIAAGAQAYLESWVEHDQRGKGKNVSVSVHMAAALDAVLDTLASHADVLLINDLRLPQVIAALRPGPLGEDE